MKRPHRLHGSDSERFAIAKRFKAYRERVGISQSELARLIGLSGHASISDIERAKHLPHHSTLRKFVEWENRIDTRETSSL